MSKYLYPIYKLKTKSYIRWWLYNYLGKFNNYVLSEILTGTSFYLEDSTDRKFNIFDIIGRSVQDGVPTPENPVPIKNTGDNGSVNEKVQNKNLIDKIITNSRAWSNGVISESSAYSRSDYIPIKPNTIYYLHHVMGNAVAFPGWCYDKNKNAISNVRIDGNYDVSGKITTPANSSYLIVNFYNDTIKDNPPMVEQSSTPSGYVPHSEQNISFPLAEGQKLMQGDYLADDGVHHKMGEYIITGDESGWEMFDTDKCARIIKSDVAGVAFTEMGNIYCNQLTKTTQRNVQVGAIDYGISVRTTGNNGFAIRNKDYSTKIQYINWFKTQYNANTPIKIQYKLATEVIDPYTEEQKTAWGEIKKARTYKNVTHISSEDETPAELKIQYWKEV